MSPFAGACSKQKRRNQAESRADELSKTQISFKRALIRDIRDFSKDVTKFRADFVRDGPMVQVCW